MPKQNILVTGANGFIGKTFVNRLDRSRFDVFALDSEYSSRPGDLPVTKTFLQDLTSPFKIDIPFHCVFHLAALNVTHVNKADYDEYYRVNVWGTENLIKAVTTQKFVFMSTVKVYQKRDGMIDEEAFVKPVDDYGKSKLEAENICRQNFGERELTVFRCVNIVGPGQALKAVIPVFFKTAINNEPLKIIYPDRTPLQMLDVGDIVRAFEKLLEKDEGIGTVNLCSDDVVTLRQLAEDIIAISRSQSSIIHTSDEKVAAVKYISNRAKAALGWQPEIPIRSILKNYNEFIAISK